MIHVLSGGLRAYILLDEGREVTLFRINQGETCILSDFCVLQHIDFDSYMTASAESSVLVVPSALFGELCERNIHVRCFAYELEAKRFSAVMHVMQKLLFFHLDQGLAIFLLEEVR